MSMSQRGETVPTTGSFFSGAFGTMNLSHNINIVGPDMKIQVSLLEDHERIQVLEQHIVVIENQITDMVAHINKINKVLEEVYFAPGGPGCLQAQQHFEELAAEGQSSN